MQRALELAKKGSGNVAPNPLVGCVIVYNDKIIGEGFHRLYGGPHAEVNAVESVKDKNLLPRSTVYVTLEPCCHFGKTPPCTDLLIEHRVKRVVICNSDPFKEVQGRGFEKLMKSGIEVQSGILAEEGRWINRRFFTFHEKQRPYVILKWAQSADGFVDALRNESDLPTQLSTPENKRLVHKWRSEESAILIGFQTAIKDNPGLTVREMAGKNPLRIVLDWNNELSQMEHLQIWNSQAKTVIITLQTEKLEGIHQWIKAGEKSAISILKVLYKMGITSILVEGGPSTHEMFIEENLWDEARVTTSTLRLNSGVKSPVLKGEIKKTFSCGNSNQVSIISPISS